MSAQTEKVIASSGTALELTGVTKRFPQPGQPAVTALDNLSLRVGRGEFVVVVGHNGSGKSTLLDIISSDLTPDAGVIKWGEGARHGHRPRVARVRQSPGEGTFAELSVLENFQIFSLRGTPSLLRTKPRVNIMAEATRRTQKHGLADRLNQRVADLSQGQRQLLALELAMSRQPRVLLLDEHTASLDRRNAARCMEATARLVRESNATVIMVTHHLADALTYGDVVVVLKDGRIVHRLSGSAKAHLSLPELLRYCGFAN